MTQDQIKRLIDVLGVVNGKTITTEGYVALKSIYDQLKQLGYGNKAEDFRQKVQDEGINLDGIKNLQKIGYSGQVSDEVKSTLFYGYMGNSSGGVEGIGIEIGPTGPKIPSGLMKGLPPLPGGGGGSGGSGGSDGAGSGFGSSNPSGDEGSYGRDSSYGGGTTYGGGGDSTYGGGTTYGGGGDSTYGGVTIYGGSGGGGYQNTGNNPGNPNASGYHGSTGNGTSSGGSSSGGYQNTGNNPGNPNTVGYHGSTGTSSTYDPNGDPGYAMSPILLDLNGDGNISITDRSKSSFYVDGGGWEGTSDGLGWGWRWCAFL